MVKLFEMFSGPPFPEPIILKKQKPVYTLYDYPRATIGIRKRRNDGMCEMHIIDKATGVHRWEIAPMIGAMDLVNGKCGKIFTE